ncbi:MAG: hypothetical protein HZB25_07940 [Candidatus Eisenbacteria bacterium]|nr:hypothetical protein [Candidatus Eisenbacteria bacterium]
MKRSARLRLVAAFCLAPALVPGPGFASPAGAPPAAAVRPAATAGAARAPKPAAAARPVASGKSDPLAGLRSGVDQFLQEREEANWANWAGGEPSRLTEVYARHADLFTPATIARVKGAQNATRDPRERKALTFLRRFLEGECVARACVPLEDSLANAMLSATVPVDTGRVPWFQLQGWMANQPDHAKRLAAYAGQDSLLEALKPVRQARLDLLRREASALGYASRFEFYQEQKGIRFTDLEKEVRAFLAATQGVYDSGLTAFAGQLKLSREELRRPDISRINRLTRYDEYFRADRMLPVMVQGFAAMGVDVSRQRNIRVDAEARPEKNPRAACFAVRVPGDVRVSVKPAGGLQDYMALFHEMGHAEHAACTRQERMEFRYLGTAAYTECMAFATEYLLEDPAWVSANLYMDRDDLWNYASQASFLRLLLVRRYAGKFLYQMDLHRGGVRPEDAYLRNMRLALGYPMDEHDARHCYEEDEGFYEADYLQAWFLEAMLKARLRAKYGPAWYASPKAGEELRTLWNAGQETTAPELAGKLGYGRVDQRPLADALRAAIHGPGPRGLPDKD